jgi:hypothetical protein
MITALVTFAPKAGRTEMSPADKLALYEATAPKYQSIPGLIRKYFMGNSERAGGWYEWDSIESAKAYYTPEWEQFITGTYGTYLRIEYFDCPCVVDNANKTITIAPEVYASVRESAEVIS